MRKEDSGEHEPQRYRTSFAAAFGSLIGALALSACASGGGADGPAGAAMAGANGGGAPPGVSGAPSGGTGAVTPSDCAAIAPAAAVPLRRLTPDEWLETARAALGGAVPDVRESLPQPSTAAPYSTYSEALRVDGGPARALMEASELVGEALAPSLTQCSAADFEACARSTISTWALAAFRRPPESADVDALLATAKAARQDGLPPNEALAVAAIGILQHPRFLYLVESRPALASWSLDDFERAARVSYTLWRAPVDDTLRAAASSGQLVLPEGMASATEHALSDRRLRAGFRGFVREWLGLAALPSSLAESVRGALSAELDLLIDRMLDAPDALAAVFQGDVGYADTILEDFYGLPKKSGGPGDFVEVHVSGRSGLLTHPLVMAKAAHGELSSVILRGKLVRMNVLCGSLGDPPPGARDLEPLGADATPRERYEARRRIAACGGCHSLMDPLGFAFESFDGLGRYRSQVNGEPVDDAAEVTSTASTNGTVKGPAELGQLLAHSDEVSTCFVRQWFRYAYGRRDDDPALRCAALEVSQVFRESGHDVRSMLRAFTGHPTFTRRAEVP